MVPSGGNCSPFDWNHARVFVFAVDRFAIRAYIEIEAGIGNQRALSRCGRMMRVGVIVGIILTGFDR